MEIEEARQELFKRIHESVGEPQSPIEHLMFTGLLFYFCHTVDIIPQARIGKYRVDFLVGRGALNNLKSKKLVVVECDGHDYHERTKDQAKRDKQRDRFFALEGYTVLRFTGSEINKDPFDCAADVFSMAMRLES